MWNRNPFIENCAEVKVSSNLVSDSINISNVSAIKLDKILKLYDV